MSGTLHFLRPHKTDDSVREILSFLNDGEESRPPKGPPPAKPVSLAERKVLLRLPMPTLEERIAQSVAECKTEEEAARIRRAWALIVAIVEPHGIAGEAVTA